MIASIGHARAAAGLRVSGKATPQRYPKNLETDYASRIALLTSKAARVSLAPLLAQLPSILSSAKASRQDSDDVRLFAGLPVCVENPAGSTRSWTDASGRSGQTVMASDYGFIVGVVGADGEEVDVFLGPSPSAPWVYVVHQSRSPTFDGYDEDKVMLGFSSADQAKREYLRHYDDPRFFGGMSTLSTADFKAALATGGGEKLAHRADSDEGRRARALVDAARARDRKLSDASRLEGVGREFAQRASAAHADELRRQVREAVGVTPAFKDSTLKAKVEHFAAENVALIRSMQSELYDDVEKLVTRAVVSGTLHKNLAKEIEERFGVTDSHARLIARDQIGKVYGQLNAARQRELGIKKFRWKTVGDKFVRDEHTEREAKSESEPYLWDEPPDDEYPGEPIQCRCTAEPVFEFDWAQKDDEPDEESDDEPDERADAYDPDQPRDEQGRFGDVSARATASLQDRAFVREHTLRLQDAAVAARHYHSQGAPNVPVADKLVDAAIHAEAMRIHQETDDERDVSLAVAAGQVEKSIPEVDAHDGLVSDSQKTLDDLHADGQVAVSELSELHNLTDYDHDIGQSELDDADTLAGELDQSTGHESETPEREGVEFPEDALSPDEDHPGHPDNAPIEDDFEDDEEGDAERAAAEAKYAADQEGFAQQQQRYEGEVARRRELFKAKAGEVQTTLEALQLKQVAALSQMKDIERARVQALRALGDDPHSLVNEKAFEHHDRDEDGEFEDEHVQKDYDRARDVSESMHDAMVSRLEDPEGPTVDNLKEATQATRDVIRQLSKITGRKANKAKAVEEGASPVEHVTLAHLEKELGVDARQMRSTLRKAGVDKPKTGWSWHPDDPQLATIRRQLSKSRTDAYDPDQPRDERGRFGEGSGEVAHPSGHVTLGHLEKELGVDAKQMRAALRRAKLEKPAAGWSWHPDDPQLATIRGLMKKTGATPPLKLVPPAAPPKVESPPPKVEPKIEPTSQSPKFNALAWAKVHNSFVGGSNPHLEPQAQAQIRRHHEEILSQYGMASRGGAMSSTIAVKAASALGSANAVYKPDNGQIVMSTPVAKSLSDMAGHDPKELGRRIGDLMANTGSLSSAETMELHELTTQARAYKTSTHEAIHGHGPQLHYRGSGIPIEEVATEVSARRVVRDALGLRIGQAATTNIGLDGQGPTYHAYITGAKGAITEALRVDSHRAYTALEKASIAYKQNPTSMRPSTPGQVVNLFVSGIDFHEAAGTRLSPEREKYARDLVTQRLLELKI